MTATDVTVYGAGIIGLCVAWSCLKHGAKVRVIDPYGVGAGASGGIVGALAPHTPERWETKKQIQFDSLLMAPKYWAEIENVSGKSTGYGRCGRVQPIANEHMLELAWLRHEVAKELWQGQAAWNVVPSTDFDEWAPASPTGYIVHDTLTARINPRLATHALADAVQRKGAEILKVGKEEGQVVWATGWRGLQALSEEIGKEVGNGEKGQGALLQHDASNLPQIFASALHIIPHANGTLAIGSTGERIFDDPTSCDEALDVLVARARKICPAITNAPVIERWANVRPRAMSRAPMLGPHPLREGHFIANGGFKIGLAMAPIMGELLANYILGQSNDIPTDFCVQNNY